MSVEDKDLLDLTPSPSINVPELNKLLEIKRESYAKLSYSDFCWRYMSPNVPVILTDVSSEWSCFRDWVQQVDGTVAVDNHIHTAASAASIHFGNLKQRIPNDSVPVADCNRTYFDSHAKTEMPFFDFLEQWQHRTEARINQNMYKNNSLYYLKDWHLQAELPDYKFYEVPKHFASDWLNEYLLSSSSDDYRFVYMGPEGTWTPFHADVYGSFSWSANIVGCKQWLMLPPGEEHKLPADTHKRVFDEALLAQYGVRYYLIRQMQNEAVFVPSGWHHQVTNETDTISVNHNWFNAFNVAYIWQCLRENLQQVIEALSDIRDCDNFWDQCQIVLRANYGLDYHDFLKNLQFIAERRVAALHMTNPTDNIVHFRRYKLSEYHIEYELKSIKRVLSTISQDETMRTSTNPELTQLCHQALRLILQALPD